MELGRNLEHLGPFVGPNLKVTGSITVLKSVRYKKKPPPWGVNFSEANGGAAAR